MKQIFLLITTLFFAITSTSIADDKDTTKTDEEKVNILPDEDFDWDFNLDNFDFNFGKKNSEWTSMPSRPIVRFNYGNSILADKNYEGIDFKENPVFDLRLGYNKIKYHNISIITQIDAHELFIQNISDDIIDNDSTFPGANLDAWRFGFNSVEGYGYKFHENLQMDFTHSSGIGWTSMNFTPNTYINGTDTTSFKTFDESIRYGEQFESSATLKFWEKLSLGVSYERINVYPRYLFWYSVVSSSVELIAHSLMDGFVKEIRKFSPELTPIFNFILKSGLSYGIYELKRKKMFWPVNTAPPLTFENFKIGASVNF
ncbi:MAG: hypothetical protein A2X64_10065 [Ignavibacteria bacterium GWF2_33_9]|nr:MAG: hypothetical protein A2X64_10065 [Ignavibacteria bacterium GWF2_33_9]